MAILGGSPNVAGGASPSGIGSSINYVLDRAYGYSGNVPAQDGQDGTMFDFTTGSEVILLDMWWSWDYEAMGDGTDYGVTLKLNGQEVIDTEQSTRASGGRVMMEIKHQRILLAPYTHFVMTNTCSTGSPVNCAMTLDGVIINA